MNYLQLFAKITRLEGITKRAYRVFFSIMSFDRLPNIEECPPGKTPEYVVSLTSWTPRLNLLPLALKGLLLQTRKPDKIVLYFGDDVTADKVPKEVLEYEKKGIEIQYVDENLRAHKKYYYAMKQYPNSKIITVDDDVIYSPFTISSLINTSSKYGNSVVCARRAHRIKFKDHKLLPYNEWEFEAVDSEPRYNLMATGVGAVLYPPHCMHPDLFDKDALKEVAFSNDDFWLKGMELLNGTQTKTVKCLWKHPIQLEKESDSSLFNINVTNGENDRIVLRLQKRYPYIFSRCEGNT